MLRFRAQLDGAGSTGLGTWYFAGPGAGSLAEAQEAHDRVRAMFLSGRTTWDTNALFAPDALVTEINPATGAAIGAFTVTVPGFVGGLDAAEDLPAQNQMLLRYSTGVYIAGREVKGRTFLPGANENGSNNGSLSAAWISGWNTAAALLDTQITTPLAQVVWHRPSAPGASDGSAVQVSSRAMSPAFAVLKSRR